MTASLQAEQRPQGGFEVEVHCQTGSPLVTAGLEQGAAAKWDRLQRLPLQSARMGGTNFWPPLQEPLQMLLQEPHLSWWDLLLALPWAPP